MLYSKAALAALLLSGEAYGFQPAVHAPLQQQRLAAAYRTVGPAVMNGIETVDFTGGSIRPQRDVTDDQMRPRPNIDWSNLRARLELEFGIPDDKLKSYDKIESEDLLKAYEMMQLCRQFENACNQAYMQGHIRGFMHLDNGQETIPAFVSDSIKKGDIKYSYYREHTHAIASGVGPGPVMAELFAKDTGTCRGTGGSMHIYDVDTHFQGGWALVSEQLPYAVGAARSIALDRHLGIAPEDDDRIAIVFCGEGGSQNGADGRVPQRGGQGEPAHPLHLHRQRPRDQHVHARRRTELGRLPSGGALRRARHQGGRLEPRGHAQDGPRRYRLRAHKGSRHHAGAHLPLPGPLPCGSGARTRAQGGEDVGES